MHFIMSVRLLICFYITSCVSFKNHIRIAKRINTSRQLLPELIATFAVSLSPIGNIDAAIKATVSDSNSVLCTLDPQQSDSFHDSCQLSPYVVRYRAGKIVTFKQDWGSSSSTGAAIWNGANIATKFLENSLGKDKLIGKTVIELGAGVGYEGIIASLLGANEVAITDGSAEVLKLADENIQLNIDSTNKNTQVYTGQLRWNTEDENNFKNKQWDYVLASDVTYLKKNRKDLITCINHLSSPSTITYLSMEPRSVDEVQDTLKEVTDQGLIYEEIPSLINKEKEGCALQCARIFAIRKPSS